MRLVDLSVPIEADAPFEAFPVKVEFRSHDGAGLEFFRQRFGVTQADLVYSGGRGAGDEMLTLLSHSGTHVDAPFHYGPISEGRPAATIDELPLEWFFSDGVVLDLRHKRPRETIEISDLEAALTAISYELRPLDIVLLQTGCDRKLDSAQYFEQPGMGRESTLWLVDQGIRVIGIDAFGFDRPFEAMAEDFRRTGDGRHIWPAHFAGITRSYCQIEKLANLDRIGRPHGFRVAAFPVKIRRASAGFARVVAFVED
jgi:kynurenine formamidase